MPICRDCKGTGQREIKKEVMTRCSDCGGTKTLPDGSACKNCNKWGEVGTGQFRTERKLCQTCMGSGKVSEGSLTTWFLVWVVPATLIIFGAGAVGLWVAQTFVEIPLVTAVIATIFLAGWGALMSYFISRMPHLGEISPATWFFIRAVPTTLVALGIGGAWVWAVWVTFSNAPVTAILAIAAFAVWGAVMYYFISHMPE